MCGGVCVWGGVGERGRGEGREGRRRLQRRLDVDEAPDVDETVYIDSGFFGVRHKLRKGQKSELLVFPAHS